MELFAPSLLDYASPISRSFCMLFPANDDVPFKLPPLPARQPNNSGAENVMRYYSTSDVVNTDSTTESTGETARPKSDGYIPHAATHKKFSFGVSANAT